MHGGGGSPEVALFNGGANYNDMVRGAVRRGYLVYASQHLFRADDFPNDIRRQIDDRMRLVGMSITAVEIVKITYAIDELIKRPEVDADLVALICPRAHQIQADARDNASHREKGKNIAPRAAASFTMLNLDDRFEHVVFEGGHEFDDVSAWGFIEKYL
jgi:hypothetical protein